MTENGGEFDCVSKDKQQMVSFDKSVQMIEHQEMIFFSFMTLRVTHFLFTKKRKMFRSLIKSKKKDSDLNKAIAASMQTNNKIDEEQEQLQRAIQLSMMETQSQPQSWFSDFFYFFSFR